MKAVAWRIFQVIGHQDCLGGLGVDYPLFLDLRRPSISKPTGFVFSQGFPSLQVGLMAAWFIRPIMNPFTGPYLSLRGMGKIQHG